jgi:hypothetical protein
METLAERGFCHPRHEGAGRVDPRPGGAGARARARAAVRVLSCRDRHQVVPGKGKVMKYGLYTCRGTCQCSTQLYHGPGSHGHVKVSAVLSDYSTRVVARYSGEVSAVLSDYSSNINAVPRRGAHAGPADRGLLPSRPRAGGRAVARGCGGGLPQGGLVLRRPGAAGRGHASPWTDLDTWYSKPFRDIGHLLIYSHRHFRHRTTKSRLPTTPRCATR